MTQQQKKNLLAALAIGLFVTSFARRVTIVLHGAEYEDEIRAAIKELEAMPTTEEL